MRIVCAKFDGLASIVLVHMNHGRDVYVMAHHFNQLHLLFNVNINRRIAIYFLLQIEHILPTIAILFLMANFDRQHC